MSNSVFDKLISGLTVEERLKMAEKMKISSVVSSEPLSVEEEDAPVDYSTYLHNLTIIERLIIFLKSLFSSNEYEKVLGDHLISKLGKSVERKSPGIIRYHEGEFAQGFYVELVNFRDSLFDLSEYICSTLEINKMDFLSFLGGWFLPEIQQRFISETDPWKLSKENDELLNFEIRRELEFRLEDILSSVSEEERRMMYRYSRSLHILNALLKFDFNHILNAFGPSGTRQGKICRFSDVRNSLKELANILHSFRFPPEQELFKAVYYYYMIQANRDPDDVEKLTEFLETAEQTMESIRLFNKRIPMDRILKIVYRNISYNPTEISGGEDWFALYKKFWYKKFEVSMLKFTLEIKKKELLTENQERLKVNKIQYLTYYRNRIWGNELSIRYEGSTAILYTFLLTMYTHEILPPLKLILEDGTFYKKQNQQEFTSSYTSIIQTLERLKLLDSSLAPGGEYALEIESIKDGEEDDLEKINMIRKLFIRIDEKVESIIMDFVSSLNLMSRLLKGITHGDVGGPYDTLSNLGYIGKGENNDLVSLLIQICYTIDGFLENFTALYDVEKSSAAE